MNSSQTEALDLLLRSLCERLREAAASYEQNGRLGAINALEAVVAFLMEFKEVRDEGLAHPLTNLAVALSDLDDGIRTPLLTTKAKRGRRPKSTQRQYLIAFVAFTRKALVSGGYSPEEAAKMIAARLTRIGVKNLGYGRLHATITHSTVKNWCEAIDPRGDDGASEMFRELESELGDRLRRQPKEPKADFRTKCLDAMESAVRALRSQDEGPENSELNAE